MISFTYFCIYLYIYLFFEREYLENVLKSDVKKCKDAKKVGNLYNSWIVADVYKQGEIALMHSTFETSSYRSRCQS